MTNVNFQCGWGQDSKELAIRYAKQCPGNVPEWKCIKHVMNNEDVTVNLQLPHNKTNNDIHFRREPDVIERWPSNVFGDNVFDYTSTDKFHVVTWWLTQTYDDLCNLEYFNKSNDISVVSSLKHQHRTNFITNLLQQYTDIDTYGAIGGNIIDQSTRDYVFMNYSKSICIENCSQPNYFTEKFTDCVLSWCLPIYWGCPNISDFFPVCSYRWIDITNISEALDIIKAPVTDAEIEAIAEARHLIMDRYNIWACIHRLLQ